MDFLTFIVVVLGLIAAWRVMRVFELSEVLKGSEEEKVEAMAQHQDWAIIPDGWATAERADIGKELQWLKGT